MNEPFTLDIESYPSQRAHFLIVRHPEGHGLYDCHGVAGTSTTLGQFRSRNQAEAALAVVRWYGENQFLDGMRAERERQAQEEAPRLCRACGLQRQASDFTARPRLDGGILSMCTACAVAFDKRRALARESAVWSLTEQDPPT